MSASTATAAGSTVPSQASSAIPANNIKVYVRVFVDFIDDGTMIPRCIVWENGTKYKVDRVTDIKPAPALRAGGQGDRYTVYVNGKQSYLFFERNSSLTGNNIGRWFVERKVRSGKV